MASDDKPDNEMSDKDAMICCVSLVTAILLAFVLLMTLTLTKCGTERRLCMTEADHPSRCIHSFEQAVELKRHKYRKGCCDGD